MSLHSPVSGLSHRIAFSTENRRDEGTIGDLSVRENLVLAVQARRGWARPLSKREKDEIVDKYMTELGVRPADPDRPIKNLSGGNQQKVLLGRWLATGPELLILDEPTRGIDVGAKAEIQEAVVQLAEGRDLGGLHLLRARGGGRLSSRIVVMKDHRKVGEIVVGPEVTTQTIVDIIAADGTQAERADRREVQSMSHLRHVADRVTTLVRKQWFWALVAIIVLLGINVIQDPTYLRISVNPQNGNLVGNLIDILRASAPIIMIAVGMSLVIATRGIDLSVGSIMVVSGAVSMEFLKSVDTSGSVGAAATAIAIALVVSTLIGVVNGLLITVLGLQPFISTLIMMLAGRGIAKVITSGQNTNAQSPPFQWLTNGYVLGIPVVFLIALAIVGVLALVVRRSAFGLMIEVHRRQSQGQPHGGDQAGRHPDGRLHAERSARRHRGDLRGGQRHDRRRLPHRLPDGAGRDPRRRHRRHLPRGWKVLHRWSRHRLDPHRDPGQDHRLPRHPRLGHACVQGDRDHRLVSAAVTAGAAPSSGVDASPHPPPAPTPMPVEEKEGVHGMSTITAVDTATEGPDRAGSG